MNWQKIETAPKDGSWVLVAISQEPWEDYPFCGVCQFQKDNWHLLVEESRSKAVDQMFGRPTHWMPLPPPPSSGIE